MSARLTSGLSWAAPLVFGAIVALFLGLAGYGAVAGRLAKTADMGEFAGECRLLWASADCREVVQADPDANRQLALKFSASCRRYSKGGADAQVEEVVKEFGAADGAR